MTDLLHATVPARYLVEVVARLRLDAAARARLLRAAGVDAVLLRRPGLRFTPAQFAVLCRDAVRAAGDEAFGYLPRAVPRGAFAFVLRAMARCPDVAACVEEGRAFYRLFDPEGGWEVDVGGATVTIRLVTTTRAQAASIFFTHSALLSAWRAVAWLAGRALPLDGVTLPAVFDRYAGETRYLFGVAPVAGAAATLRFPRAYLVLPVARTVDDVADYRRAALRHVLGAPPSDPIEERVRRVLAEWRPFADASVEETARRLGMARPTLARHLQRLGTSFAALRDELRRDRAVVLLGRGGFTVAEVAEALGYSEPSAFQRAFKAWTGVPPRSRLIGSSPPGWRWRVRTACGPWACARWPDASG